MSKSNLPSQIRPERVPNSTVRAVVALIVGLILIVAGILLAFKNSPVSTRESPTLQSTPRPPATSASSLPSSDVAKSVNPREKVAANQNELGQTLEEFQAEYESLSTKGGDQETFFKTLVGKKVVWTVRVDRVFLTEPGVIVIFSSTERPDWAAFPISDALFPAQIGKATDEIVSRRRHSDRGQNSLSWNQDPGMFLLRAYTKRRACSGGKPSRWLRRP